MDAVYVVPNLPVHGLQTVQSMNKSLNNAFEYEKSVAEKYAMLVFYLSKDGKNFQMEQLDTGIM